MVASIGKNAATVVRAEAVIAPHSSVTANLAASLGDMPSSRYFVYVSLMTTLLSTSIPMAIISAKIVIESRFIPKSGMIPKVAITARGKEILAANPIFPGIKRKRKKTTRMRPVIPFARRTLSLFSTSLDASRKVTIFIPCSLLVFLKFSILLLISLTSLIESFPAFFITISSVDGSSLYLV